MATHKLQSLIEQHLPVGPGGFLAARVHRLLSHDTVLRNVFEDRIELAPQLWSVDYGDVPKLQIAATVSGTPTMAPGQREMRPVEVTTRITYHATEWEPFKVGPHPSETITTAHATMWDLINHVVTLLKKNKSLLEDNEAMVSPGDTEYEVVNVEPVVFDDRTAVFNQDIRVTFMAWIDDDGKLYNRA